MLGLFYGRKLWPYPIFGERQGDRIDFYYDPEKRSWYLRHRMNGQDTIIRLFRQGKSFALDYETALKRARLEAEIWGLTATVISIR
jgi:hypothetical protein